MVIVDTWWKKVLYYLQYVLLFVCTLIGLNWLIGFTVVVLRKVLSLCKKVNTIVVRFLQVK